ncbi:MAG: hypothetical protein ACLGSA_14450 [Acidobacteriota bacterium]
MMSDINIATSIAQLPNLQGIAGAQQAHPEAQQIFAAQMAQQALKEQQHQVQKVDKQEGSEAVKEDRDNKRGEEHELRQRKRHARQDAEPEEEAPAPSSSPWLGHLVNRKV